MKDTGLSIGCHGTHSTPANDRKRPLWAMANALREGVVRAEELRGRIVCVHGPRRVESAPDELVVLCLVRDGEMWIKSFVEHYLALGVRHIVFLDNGSSDDTVALASQYDRVTVLTTELPFKHFEVGLRRWLTREYGTGRWTLAPDADELWDYPCSDRLSIADLLRYLDRYGYKVVTAHALDMFSNLPFSALHSTPDDDVKRTYRYYDITDIIATRDVYWIRNGQTRSADVVSTFGGIRQRFFGSECLCQTRHALLFTDADTAPYKYDGHFTARAPVADITTVLLHYKFIGTVLDQARTNLAMGQHWGGSVHYRGIHEVLTHNPDFSFMTENARELGSVDELVDAGFLTLSPAYRRWVAEHGSGPASRGRDHVERAAGIRRGG